MNQIIKTAIFLGVAVAVTLTAWLTWPALRTGDKDDVRGQLLFPKFDPVEAASLRIVDFDEDTSTLRPFEVTQVKTKGKTRWTIPSHDNYPADAQEQLVAAATALMGLKILEVSSDNPGDHELFGVVDPESKESQGSTGVGTRVVIKDKKDKTLLSVVIGKAVADRPGLRYLRRDDEDRVYAVELKTDPLSPRFGDWIEKDLLQMKSSWDLQRVWIRDYSVDLLQRKEKVQQKSDLTLAYDDATEPRWKLIRDEIFRNNRPVPGKLAPDEELNTANLDDMKTALENLKIVDVCRKPAGLSADLKANADFLNNEEACESLSLRGFFPAGPEGQPDLLSNQGEVRFLMKDGVEYVLRFGAATGSDSSGKNAKKGGKKIQGQLDLNRYLLVMAEFNPEAIAKPVPIPLPPEPAKEEKAERGKTGQKIEKAANADKGKPTEKSKPADKAKATPTDKAGKGAAAKPELTKKEPPKPDLKAERQRIEKENKRNRELYEEKIAQGQKHVKELNDRFADWYYVISDDVYRKIHLSRDQVVKKKEKKDAHGKTGTAPALHDHGDHDHDHDHDDAGEFETPAPMGNGEKPNPRAPGGQP